MNKKGIWFFPYEVFPQQKSTRFTIPELGYSWDALGTRLHRYQLPAHSPWLGSHVVGPDLKHLPVPCSTGVQQDAGPKADTQSW